MENQNDGSIKASAKHYQGTDRKAGRYKTMEFDKARGNVDIKVGINYSGNSTVLLI